jgi:hypothetical protein
MTRFLPHVLPEQMTTRARAYLCATMVYCFAIGLACLLYGDSFNSSPFQQIKVMMPWGLNGWGFLYMVVGCLSARAAWKGSEHWAWAALIGATAVVGPWASGFWVAWLQQPDPFTNPTTAPTGVVTYTWVTVTHVIQARQPLRSPFDPVLRRSVSMEGQ